MDSEPNSVARFTGRAVTAGAVISLLMAIGAPFSRYVLYSSPLVFTSFSWGVVTTWLLFVVFEMGVLRRFRFWRPMSSPEFAVAFMIATVGSSLTTTEVAGPIVTHIGGIHYFASPENRWHETLDSLLPVWLLPTDTHNAVKWLFDGVPQGQTYPWADWIVPLFWHGSFTAAFLLVQFALVGLLRKHWVEHERLTFPIMQMAVELIQQPEKGEFRPPWSRPRLFWFGFFIPITFLTLQMLSWFWPTVPQLPTNLGAISFGTEYPALNMNLYWPVIGIAFFANKEVIFSLLFFTVLGTLVTGWLTRLGIDVGVGAQPMQWLNMGALTVMVLWFLWLARRHLWSAARRAMGKPDGDDDSNEFISYRAAYLIIIGAVAYMVFWMQVSGSSIAIALLFIAMGTIVYLGIARLSFEAGVFHVNAPLRLVDMIVDATGSANISHASMAALAQHYWRFSNVKSLFLVTFGHAGALSQQMEIPRRRLNPAIVIVTVATTLLATWYTLYLGVAYGGYNFTDWIFRSGPADPFISLMKWISNPLPADFRRITFFGIGGGLMVLFSVLRYAFPWWPLHPIGLAICFSFHIKESILSFLIAWVAKSLTLRLGGIRLFRRTVPLFVGIVVGAFVGTAMCFLVDLIWFPMSGHAVEFK